MVKHTRPLTRKAYLSDVTDEEWAFLARYLSLVRADAPQRQYGLRAPSGGAVRARDEEAHQMQPYLPYDSPFAAGITPAQEEAVRRYTSDLFTLRLNDYFEGSRA